MPRPLRLTHRLMLLWLVSATVALIVSGLAFLLLEARESEITRRTRIEAAFGILQNHVGEKSSRLATSARTLAERRSVVATVGLFAHYFDPARDDGVIFDGPSQELADELAELARAAGADWAAIVGPYGPIGGYWRSDGAEVKAYFSIRAGDARVFAADHGSDAFRSIDAGPSFLEALRGGAPVPAATLALVRCATGPGPAVLTTAPVMRQLGDRSEPLPGFVLLGACFDAKFVDQIARQTGTAFGILGEQKLLSDAMPDIIPPAAASELPAMGDGAMRLAALRWQTEQAHILGAGDWILDDGSRSTAMFVLGQESLAGQRTALLTAGMTGLGLTALLIFLVGLLYLRRKVTRPLAKLAAAVANVRLGRYEPIAGIAPGDELGELAATFNHMTERIRAREEELRRLSRAVEQSPAVVIITSPEGCIEYVNPRYIEVTGYTAEEVVGRNPGFLKSGQLPDEVYSELWRTIKAGKVWRGELSNLTRDGFVIFEQTSISPIFDDAGRIQHYVAVQEDVTERKKNEARISHLAFHDVLTELPNRRLFRDRLNQALSQYHRHRLGFALHLLDLDHFKDVNDSLGHTVGDELLRMVAARVQTLLRDTDTLSRFGGDEFAILQSGIDGAADAAILAEKVIAAFREPFAVGQLSLHSNTSIGIALPEAGLRNVDELISRADIALYKAKEAGRGGFVYFDDAMTARVQGDAELTNELARALERGQLFLEYQPQIDLASGALVGVESLLRWRHPQQGVIGPVRFIPLAESRGMMGEIGLWVLAESCRQWIAWRDQGLAIGRIAVNVSAVQIKGGRGFEQILAIVESCGMPPGTLEIEFTESAFVDVSADTLQWIARLRALEVGFAIDDFGTGYSSLLMLRQLQAHKLKIDREFVKDMLDDPNDAAIVRATVSLAKSLGMMVVAEGIEAPAQAEALRAIGCDVGQGFLFARPMSPAAILERYRSPRPAGAVALSPSTVGSPVDNV